MMEKRALREHGTAMKGKRPEAFEKRLLQNDFVRVYLVGLVLHRACFNVAGVCILMTAR